MRYYLHDNGGWLTASGDESLFTVPEGYREVTEPEFNEATGAIIVPLAPAPAGGDDEPPRAAARKGKASKAS